MANLSGAIRRIRRARRAADAPATEFERYRPAYEAVLTAVADDVGDEAFEELETWLLDTTRARGSLPPPGALRKKARALYRAHGVEVPESSPVRG